MNEILLLLCLFLALIASILRLCYINRNRHIVNEYWEINKRGNIYKINQRCTRKGCCEIKQYRKTICKKSAGAQNHLMAELFSEHLTELFDALEPNREYNAFTHNSVINKIKKVEKSGSISIINIDGSSNFIILPSICYGGISKFFYNLIFNRENIIKKHYKIRFAKN